MLFRNTVIVIKCVLGKPLLRVNILNTSVMLELFVHFYL